MLLHSQPPDNIYRAEGNPFYVAPREDRNSFVDLQAIALGLRAEAGMVAYVDGDHMNALDGGLAHTGEDKTGYGSGWDEMVTVSLPFIPDDVRGVALFAHCKSSHMLSEASNGKYGLFSMRDQSVLMEGDLKSEKTTHLIGMIRRYQDDFVIQPLDFSFNALSLDDVLATVTKFW